jgi:uncharacterized protein (TIGR00251 family)
MRKDIRVRPGSGRDGISMHDGVLVVQTKAPAEGNRANISVIKMLTRHFGRDVRIVSGHRSRKKVVEIRD